MTISINEYGHVLVDRGAGCCGDIPCRRVADFLLTSVNQAPLAEL
jgi:hypothetical protein